VVSEAKTASPSVVAAEQRILYPLAERRFGGPLTIAALQEAYLDLRRRAAALSAVVPRLESRPPSGSDLDALRAGLYRLWATLGQYLNIEETVVFSAPNSICTSDELETLGDQFDRAAGRVHHLPTEANIPRFAPHDECEGRRD
jgi:hypothetical protein